VRRRLEEVDERHQGVVEAEDCVRPTVNRVAEKRVAYQIAFQVLVGLRPEVKHHVVGPLECVAGHLRMGRDELEIVVERALPMLVAEALPIQLGLDRSENRVFCGHAHAPPWRVK